MRRSSVLATGSGNLLVGDKVAVALDVSAVLKQP
jgi:hypothetical protein